MHSDGTVCQQRALVSFAPAHPSFLIDREALPPHRTAWTFQFHTSQFAAGSHQLNVDDSSCGCVHPPDQSGFPTSGRTFPKYSDASRSNGLSV